MKDLEEYASVKEILKSVSEGTQTNVRMGLKSYLEFVNNREGQTNELTPDDLIEEAHKDVEITEERLMNFYNWLQGKNIEGYKPRQDGKTIRASSAYLRAFSLVRSFYRYNKTAFDKGWTKRIPKPEEKTAIKKDNIYDFYKVDEEKGEIYFDREMIQRFLSNLKLRDQAITLALFSSALDSGDLLKLNVVDIREQRDRKRIYLDSSRHKTSVRYRTFLSTEATNYVRRYIEQERDKAKDEDPLFIIAKNHGETIRMQHFHLSSIYRDTAKKTGIKWRGDEWNPLRPKRLRSLFRTACDKVGVPELYNNAFMGHKPTQGQSYSETSMQKLELEYLRLEPTLTVYGNTDDISRLEARLDERSKKFQETIDSLANENIEIKKNYKKVEDDLEKLRDKLNDYPRLEAFVLRMMKLRETESTNQNARANEEEEEARKQKLEELGPVTNEPHESPKISDTHEVWEKAGFNWNSEKERIELKKRRTIMEKKKQNT